MTRGGGENDDPIAGLSMEAAIDAVVEGDDRVERVDARVALGHVIEDGTVSWAAADESLVHASKVVSTPETRLELAELALSEAREAAEPVADLDAVRARLDDLETRLADLEAGVADLGADLQAVVRRCEAREDLLAVARGLRDLTAEANRVHGAIEDLKLDVEAFETWLGSHGVRARELAEDADGLAGNVDALAGAIDELTAAIEDGSAGGSDHSDAESGREPAADPGLAWFDATLRQRVTSLLVADLRAELDDVRTLADRDGIDDGDRLDEVEDALDDLDARVEALDDRLAGLAEADWRARFEDRLTAFASGVEDLEFPIDWGEVQATLDEYRAGLDGAARPGAEGAG